MTTVSEFEANAMDLEPIEVKSSVLDTGANTKSLTLTVPSTEIDKAYDKLVNKYAGEVRLPGFRPGKVPRAMIEKLLKDDLKNQVTHDVVSRGIFYAVRNEKIITIGPPVLVSAMPSAERGKDLTIEVNLEIQPEFELCNYKGLSVEQEEVELLPGEVDAQLERLSMRFAEEFEAPSDTTLKERDIAKGVLRYMVDGNEVRKEDDAALLLHEGHVVGAYAHIGLDYLDGARVGELRTVDAVLGTRFPLEDMRGKNARIEFELKQIKRNKIPPCDDELAKKLGAESAEALRKQIESTLKENLAEETTAKTRRVLLDQVVSGSPFDPPKRMAKAIEDRMVGKWELHMNHSGDLTSWAQDKLSKHCADFSKIAVRRYFVADAICRKENVKVSIAELDEEVFMLAHQRGQSVAELFKEIDEQEIFAQLRMSMLEQKALDILVENAEIKIVARKTPEKKQPDCGHDHGHKP